MQASEYQASIVALHASVADWSANDIHNNSDKYVQRLCLQIQLYICRRVWLTKAVVGVHVMSFRLFTFPQCSHEAKHSYGFLYSLWDRENPQHSGLILL